MELALDQDQLALADVVGTLLQKHSSPERVRAAEADGFDEALWQALAELGLPGVAVGDDAASTVDLIVIAEAAGRALATVPLAESIVAAILLYGRHDTGTAVGLGAQIAVFSPVVARRGVARLVPGAGAASFVVAFDGERLLLADCAGARRPAATLASLAFADVSLADATVIAEGAEAAALYEDAMTRWRCLTAGIEVGIAAASLDLGVDYVKTRYQFGVPIASFQAVQHGLADAVTATDGARLLTYEAAAAIDAGSARAQQLALMAYLFAAETAHATAGASLHYHGGYGYMLEYDVQLYFRRAKTLQLLAGDPDEVLDDLAGALFDTTEVAR
jgi:alkylation response protein AidB-like acyl-CoA dehydrogenase